MYVVRGSICTGYRVYLEAQDNQNAVEIANYENMWDAINHAKKLNEK